ncbi:MAG: lipoyl(octanoyl) transferase [Candidatus Dadabacteria bacterium RIFCSPHIGHO2_12_FULL_53_21]|nr:MAG: lipoyl(octanoyl) transferase [Candidatus Dadabacteria bacterium RIFCSPHIGHO2_12_FULL_53_21]
MNTFKVYKLGKVPYRKALEIQLRLLEMRTNGEIGDTLLLLEHPPTFTIGRRGNMGNLLAAKNYLSKAGIHFEVISRGGDITYHGPGQLVGYPIMDLNGMGRDVHKYLRNLEETIIVSLGDFGIRGRRIKGITGVWTKWHKIASIGVGVRRWVTYHGFALNVNTDLSYFDMIVPCGIENVKMTSIQRWLAKNEEIDMPEAEESIIKAFSHVFNITHTKTTILYSNTSEESPDFDLLLEIEKRLEDESDLTA